MKTALIVSTVCAVALNAYAQQPGAPQGAAAAAPISTISVTGCLQQADADGSIAGTPLGTSAPPDQAGAVANRNLPWQGFLLADARPAEGAAAPARNDAGTTAAPASAAQATGTSGTTDSKLAVTYALDGDTNQLAGLKGQRVEVTGAVMEAAPSQAGASGSTSTFKTGVKRLKVTAIKSVAPAC
jgi:hypothetical protein